MTATLNSGYPFESTGQFVGTTSYTYSRLTVTQSTDPNAIVGENVDFYGFGHTTGLQYSQFGLWVLNSSLLNSGSNYIGTYGGALSPTPAGAVPTTGSATFNGLAVGSIQNAPSNSISQVAGFSGDLTVNANFTAGTVSGSITGIQAYILNVLKGSVNDIGIAGTISGTNISGTTIVTGAPGSGYDITGATGKLVGIVAGPTANEVAGSFYLSGGPNANSLIGSYGAGQAIAASTPAAAPTTTFFSDEATIGGTSPNFTASNLKTGQFVSYTGALPNGVTGSPATSTIAITTAGGTVSGTVGLGNSLQSNFGLTNATIAQYTVNSSTDAAIPSATGAGNLQLLDQVYVLNYATFGAWDLSPNTAVGNATYVGVVAGGKPGVSPTAAGSMPTTGTANYTGGAVGVAVQPGGYTVPSGSTATAGTAAYLTGTLNLTATWSSNTLNGSITGINAYATGGSGALIGTVNDINLASTISGSSVSGTATAAGTAGTAFNIAGAAGPLQGAFYGPSANEVAGTFHVTGGTNNVTVIGSFGAKPGSVTPSDRRLKTAVRAEGRLANGLQLYSWRYLGGAHRFTGVMAQDLLADGRFAGAVEVEPDGLMQVDYSQIGYEPDRLEAMQADGEQAVATYRRTMH